jgi:nucleoside-diphosphate-sugar epimerase
MGKFARVVVTGGAGFIGCHLVDSLVAKGFEVTVIDDLSSGKISNIEHHRNLKNFRFVQDDIRNGAAVKKILKDADVVFHLAALVSVPKSIDEPLITNDVNLNGTLNLLENSLKFGVRRFIFASSAAIYGEQEVFPIPESAVPKPISPYAISKMAAEYYVKSYYENYGLETVSLRYFNVYGDVKFSGPENSVIPLFVNCFLQGRRPEIYGDGEQTRDFINVSDVVRVNMLAMEHNCVGEILNIASGSPITINRLVKILQSTMGKDSLRPVYLEARRGDIRQSWADVSKAFSVMNFKASISIEQGIARLLGIENSDSD